MTEKNWKALYEKECEAAQTLRSANNALTNQAARYLERIGELIEERDRLQAIVNNPDSAYSNLRNNHEILQRALEEVYHTTHTHSPRQPGASQVTHLDPDSDVAFTIKWWGILLALIIGTVIIFAVLSPYLRAQETRDHRQSLEYIQSHQGALRQIYTQYSDEALSDAQRRALFHQLRHEADLIPNSVPADIQDALNRGVR